MEMIRNPVYRAEDDSRINQLFEDTAAALSVTATMIEEIRRQASKELAGKDFQIEQLQRRVVELEEMLAAPESHSVLYNS